MDSISIAAALDEVNQKVRNAVSKRAPIYINEVFVVAVSKTKPKEMIIEAYNHGQRHFGENYVHELEEKAKDPEILEKCPDIKWHFIGHLQSNKVNKLLAVPNLYLLHTIDSIKLADIVDKAWEKTENSRQLKVMVQINTSEEESKGGVRTRDASALTKHLLQKCQNLCLVGFMTIGYAEHAVAEGPNPEFKFLLNFRDHICRNFGVEFLDLSMGMSQDFEHAIEMGSSYVRIGSSIFGSRV